MNPAIEFLSFPDTWSRLAQILGCVEEDKAIRDTTMAEYIRACIYQPFHWQHDWGTPQAVHTSRVITAVRKDIGFLWENAGHLNRPQLEEDDCSQSAKCVLQRLGSIGDIAKLGGGFWAPGPDRIIKSVATGDASLLITSGAPFEVLEKKYSAQVSCVGGARFFHLDRIELQQFQLKYELQSVQDWLGCPLEDLATWTRRIFSSLVANMSAEASLEASDCEIYAPDNIAGKPSGGNWLPIRKFSIVPTGLRFCRPPLEKATAYDRPTYLLELRNDGGRAIIHRSVLVPTDVRCRLMFGFEQMKGVKRTVTLEATDQICRFKIPFKLPDPESRILDFGWPAGNDFNGRINVVECASHLIPFLIQVMTRLNIHATVRNL